MYYAQDDLSSIARPQETQHPLSHCEYAGPQGKQRDNEKLHGGYAEDVDCCLPCPEADGWWLAVLSRFEPVKVTFFRKEPSEEV